MRETAVLRRDRRAVQFTVAARGYVQDFEEAA
jgi:hypothetical protein